MSNVASETLETEQKIGVQTRPNDAAAAVAGAASPAAATGTASLQNVPFATPKHHGPEGRTSPRSAPKKVSNVASETLETEQKIGTQTRPNVLLLLLLLLLLLVLLVLLLQLVLQASKTYPSPHQNTMALKDELVREAHPKSV